MIDVEGKRAEAKALRGVSYDARIDRFTAEIYVGKERQWLGSYVTSAEASAAYLEAAEQRGPVVRSTSAFRQVYGEFRARHGGQEVTPPEGAVLEYDGQRFVFGGMTWRRQGGRTFAYMTWSSTCRACGEEYRTMSPAALSVAKGVTRNCPQHVQGRGFSKKPSAGAQSFRTLGERLVDLIQPLALVHERVPVERVLEMVEREGLGTVIKDVGAMSRVLANMNGKAETSLGFALVDEHIVFA